MTILEETMNKLVRDSVNLILELPDYSIKAKQGKPRPLDGYCSVDFVSDVPVGLEEEKHTDETEGTKIKYDYAGAREITFSLNFHKDNAVDYARRVHIGLVRQSIYDLFWGPDLGIGLRSQVREISEALEGTWEERAQFDFTINAVGRDDELIESIGSLDIAAEFQARGLKYNYNIEVTE